MILGYVREDWLYTTIGPEKRFPQTSETMQLIFQTDINWQNLYISINRFSSMLTYIQIYSA